MKINFFRFVISFMALGVLLSSSSFAGGRKDWDEEFQGLFPGLEDGIRTKLQVLNKPIPHTDGSEMQVYLLHREPSEEEELSKEERDRHFEFIYPSKKFIKNYKTLLPLESATEDAIIYEIRIKNPDASKPPIRQIVGVYTGVGVSHSYGEEQQGEEQSMVRVNPEAKDQTGVSPSDKDVLKEVKKSEFNEKILDLQRALSESGKDEEPVKLQNEKLDGVRHALNNKDDAAFDTRVMNRLWKDTPRIAADLELQKPQMWALKRDRKRKSILRRFVKTHQKMILTPKIDKELLRKLYIELGLGEDDDEYKAESEKTGSKPKTEPEQGKKESNKAKGSRGLMGPEEKPAD